MGVIAFIGLFGCSRDAGEPQAAPDCDTPEAGQLGYAELKALYSGQPTELAEDHFLEGVVVSSDRDGNIYGSIFLQDRATSPEHGLEIKTDLTGSHALYPPGTRIRVLLKGLYLGRQGGGYALGTARDVFGSPVLDRIPAQATRDRVLSSCGETAAPEPINLPVEALDTTYLHTLVRIQDIEIASGYAGSIFAEEGVETVVPLSGCSGSRLALVNSGYSDFRARPLPSGSGAATGVLTGTAGDYRLLLRYAEDLSLSGQSCGDRFPPVSSDALLISEIADPDNEAGARFLELFNAGDQSLDLKGWALVRYTNANTEPGRPADLSGLRIAPGATLVFTANPEVFEAVYGFPPDVELPANGPADSNGDDTIALVDPFGEVTDVFGVPGEDGSGTSHEFEDGGAFRRAGILKANPGFTPAEWTVYNDSGQAGTEFRPLSAPADFTPGTHGPAAGKPGGS